MDRETRVRAANARLLADVMKKPVKVPSFTAPTRKTRAKFKQAKRGSARPFRVFDAKMGELLRGRNYKYPRNALDQAFIFARWSLVGESLEIFDATDGRLIGTCTRKENSIQFTGPQRADEL